MEVNVSKSNEKVAESKTNRKLGPQITLTNMTTRPSDQKTTEIKNICKDTLSKIYEM